MEFRLLLEYYHLFYHGINLEITLTITVDGWLSTPTTSLDSVICGCCALDTIFN